MDIHANEQADTAAPVNPGLEGDDDAWVHRSRHIGIEIALSAFFVAIGIGLVVLAGSIRAGSIPDPITSAGMPRIAGALLTVFAGVMLARFVALALRNPQNYRIASQGDNDEVGHPSSFLRPVLVVVTALIWTWAIDRIGYFLATPLLILAVLWVMDVRSRSKLIAVPLGFTVIVWLLFAELLGIGFPLGFMDSPLRQVGFIG